MKLQQRVAVLIVILGLLGLQAASLFDDPDHFHHPSPDCPICMAKETPVCMDLSPDADFTPIVMTALPKITPSDPHSPLVATHRLIRAPPFSTSTKHIFFRNHSPVG